MCAWGKVRLRRTARPSTAVTLELLGAASFCLLVRPQRSQHRSPIRCRSRSRSPRRRRRHLLDEPAPPATTERSSLRLLRRRPPCSHLSPDAAECSEPSQPQRQSAESRGRPPPGGQLAAKRRAAAAAPGPVRFRSCRRQRRRRGPARSDSAGTGVSPGRRLPPRAPIAERGLPRSFSSASGPSRSPYSP